MEYSFVLENEMKRTGLLCMSALFIFALSPIGNASAQNASYMGRYCWTITVTDTTVTGMTVPATFVLTSDIVGMGGVSYTLTGYTTDPGDNPAVYGGVGHIVGNTLYLNLTGSQKHIGQDRDTSVFHAEIDPTTLAGTFYEVGNDFNVVTRSPDSGRYTAGTIALAPTCP